MMDVYKKTNVNKMKYWLLPKNLIQEVTMIATS